MAAKKMMLNPAPFDEPTGLPDPDGGKPSPLSLGGPRCRDLAAWTQRRVALTSSDGTDQEVKSLGSPLRPKFTAPAPHAATPHSW